MASSILPIIKTTYKKYYKCSKCNFTSNTLFHLKKHTAENHLSIKDKKELPYYCKICDSTSISKLYFDRHLDSEKHLNALNKLNQDKLDKDIKKYIDDSINKMKKEIIKEMSLLIFKPKFSID